MKLTHRIVRGNELVGFRLVESDAPMMDSAEEEMMSMDTPMESIYSTRILSSLTNSGYKILGYGGAIQLPNGDDVSCLPTIDINDVNEFWTADFGDTPLTDAEASKYYSFATTMESIAFKEPVAYEINTREELENYIKRVALSVSNFGFYSDNRPLNSFVNPEALYTIDEIEQDRSIITNLNTLNYRHVFKDYSAYERTVKFLIDAGVLTTDTPTVGEFIRAYYAWGPEGIRGNCVDMQYKAGVDGAFQFVSDPLATRENPEKFVADNRTRVPFVMDNKGSIRYLNDSVNLKNILDVTEFERKPLAICNATVYQQYKRQDSRGYKYTPGYCHKSMVSDRVYFVMMSDEGFAYTYKVAHNATMLCLNTSSSPVWMTNNNFYINTILGGCKLTLDMVTSHTNYILWNICINKCAKLIGDRTVDAPVRSSYEILMNVGMSPISAVKYMAKHVLSNQQCEANGIVLGSYPGLKMDCISKYYNDIPADVLEAFKLKTDDVSDGIVDFIEKADVDNLLDRRMLMDNGDLVYGMEGYDPTYTKLKDSIFAQFGEDAVSFYSNVKFVYDCINHTVNIDNFGDGLREDTGSSYVTAASVLMSIIYGEKGENAGPEAANDILENLEIGNIIDIKNIFKQRDNAYKGYFLDLALAMQNKANAENTWSWCYITKLFRELSNKPVADTRPYMMEMLVVTNDGRDKAIRNLMVGLVKDAIKNSDAFSNKQIYDRLSGSPYAEQSYKDIAMMMADWIASNLTYKCIAEKKEEGKTATSIDIKVDIDHTLTVTIPMQAVDLCKQLVQDKENHVKYMTIFDYNEMEYEPRSSEGSFIMHTVNAIITPWSVIPKKGFSIKAYSLLPSFYDSKALIDKFGEAWYNTGVNEKKICPNPLKQQFKEKLIPVQTPEEYVIMDKEIKGADYEDLQMYLKFGEFEHPEAYIKRWALACQQARGNGRAVMHMPMKQDLVYGKLCEVMLGKSAEDELITFVGDNHALDNTETNVISWNTSKNLLDVATTGKYTLTKVQAGTISTSLFADIYINLILGGKIIAISGNWIVTADDYVFVPGMDVAVANNVFSRFAHKCGDEWYLVGTDGIYKIGVKTC